MKAINDSACVILVTGYSAKETWKHLPCTGLSGFIHKPYRVGDLVGRIRSALTT